MQQDFILKLKSINKHRIILYIAIFGFLSLFSITKGVFFGNVSAAPKMQNALQDSIYLETSDNCRITIKTMPEIAPKHVARIKELCKKKFYDGLDFHRVIKGFVAQAGGKGDDFNYGSGKKITAEFSREKHTRGMVSMARSSDLNSADSQFFIVLDNAPFLDGKYSIWGMVVDGMECVDKIKLGDQANNGMVAVNSTKIKSMRLAMDVEINKAKSGK